MMALPTPGAYLKKCRCAQLLSIADVAARLLPTQPATPEHLVIDQLELIEADAQPMTLDTVAALRAVYTFDIEVLLRLAAIAQGQELPEPHLCEICGWGTVYDQVRWPALGLCHACYAPLSPEDIAARVAERAHPAFRSAAA